MKKVEIISACYVQDFIIAITFSNGKTRLVDFLSLFHKYVKEDNLKYFAPSDFKKFIVKNGNIYWGKNEDIIFPINTLLDSKKANGDEEILYVI